FHLSRCHVLPRSAQRVRFRRRALQPVRHPHLAVHRRRGGEVLLRLFSLAGALVELAEAEVAVGDEGAHTEFTSELRTTRPATSSRLGGRPCRNKKRTSRRWAREDPRLACACPATARGGRGWSRHVAPMTSPADGWQPRALGGNSHPLAQR